MPTTLLSPGKSKLTIKSSSPIEIAQYQDAARFCREVESLVVNKGMSYIDSIVHLCDVKQIEPEKAATLINPNIREAIRLEAVRLHMVEASAHLPF